MSGIHFQRLRVSDEKDESEDQTTDVEGYITSVKWSWKKCRSLFNSWLMIVVAVSVFILAIAISVVIVKLVSEPQPPFYNG